MYSKARVSARLANLTAALAEINSMGTVVAGGGGGGGWAPVRCGGNAIKGVFVYVFNCVPLKLTFSKGIGLFGTD